MKVEKEIRFRVDAEIPLKDSSGNSDGTALVAYSSKNGCSRELAESLVAYLKHIHLGGRLMRLDGQHRGGTLIEQWPATEGKRGIIYFTSP